jgi:putative flippase GtrA
MTRFFSHLYLRYRRLLGEVTRFGMVGLFTNLVYFAILPVLVYLFSVELWLASAISYALSMLVNYTLQRQVTFRSKNAILIAGPRYIIIQLGGLVINSAILYLLVTRLGLHIVVGQVISIVAATVWNYLGQKLWVFAEGSK